MIGLVRYKPSMAEDWDAFVDASKNGTFLFHRGYMDYQAHRLEDLSWFVMENDTPIALLPGNKIDSTLWSHGGLTYGGFVTGPRMTAPVMLDVFQQTLASLQGRGLDRLIYKTIPHIYHRLPAEEDRYALFRLGARLYRRDLLSVVNTRSQRPIQGRRQRAVKVARNAKVQVQEAQELKTFWRLLADRLSKNFGTAPTHSLEEITLLKSRFPENIRLFEARLIDQVVAGVVMYESSMTAHVQYSAASDTGYEVSALDSVLSYLLEDIYADRLFFDFGASTEQEGQNLNRGLVDYKEGFGARTVVHDFFEIDLG